MASQNLLIARDENMTITHDLFQTFRLPETLIIRPDGNLGGKLVGANWQASDLEKFLEDPPPQL